jgi:hypothetical protein
MSVITFEGVIENGQIQLPPDVRLPEKGRVFIVVPDQQESKPSDLPAVADPTKHLYSPRLRNRRQAADFHMEIRDANA